MEIIYPNGLRVPLETLIRWQVVRIVREGLDALGERFGGSHYSDEPRDVATYIGDCLAHDEVSEIRISITPPP